MQQTFDDGFPRLSLLAGSSHPRYHVSDDLDRFEQWRESSKKLPDEVDGGKWIP